MSHWFLLNGQCILSTKDPGQLAEFPEGIFLKNGTTFNKTIRIIPPTIGQKVTDRRQAINGGKREGFSRWMNTVSSQNMMLARRQMFSAPTIRSINLLLFSQSLSLTAMTIRMMGITSTNSERLPRNQGMNAGKRWGLSQ